MTVTRMTSREFNQDTGRAKNAAHDGPVIITDRGRSSHVLLSIEEYEYLSGDGRSIVEMLAAPPDAADAELEIPALEDRPRPAELD